MRQRFRALRREEGQALVELAFVLPLLLLFLFAIIEFGLAINQQNTQTDLANITARMVSVLGTGAPKCGGTTQSTLQDWVNCEASATGQSVKGGYSACAADLGGASPSSTYTAGDPVEVKVTSTFNWMSLLSGGDGYIGKVVNPTTNLTGSATMRLEQAPSSGNVTFLGSPCA